MPEKTGPARVAQWTIMRRRLVVGALALTTAAVSGVVGVSPRADAAATVPVLKLESTRAVVTGYRYHKVVFFDPGAYAVAGSEPFEVRANRTAYSQKLTGTWMRAGGNQVLPSGLLDEQFNGLAKFFVVTITNRAGKVVSTDERAFCPNGYETVRRRPDAPAASPYPTDCGDGGNPYLLGAVYGLQAGYATAVGYSEAKLKLGTYTATTTIAKKYSDLLGIAPADAASTVTLKVVKGNGDLAARVRASAHRPSTKVAAAASSRPTGAAIAPTGPRPDLRSLPAWGIQVTKGRYLAFSATVWNGGPGPLVVDGFRKTDDENLMDAYQYFFDPAGHQIGYAPVGTMEWDARKGHQHWHFTDFATYQLLDQDKKLVVRSQKEAFCLANTDAVDYTVPGANWKPDNTDLQTACGERESIGVREVLETGSGDTYEQFRPGQSFDLKGLKNGVYYIEVRANPLTTLYEASTSNNVAYRQVKISGRSGHRKVKVAQVGIIDE